MYLYLRHVCRITLYLLCVLLYNDEICSGDRPGDIYYSSNRYILALHAKATVCISAISAFSSYLALRISISFWILRKWLSETPKYFASRSDVSTVILRRSWRISCTLETGTFIPFLLHKFQKKYRANNRTPFSRVRSLRAAMLRKPCFGSYSCLILFLKFVMQ